MSSSLRMLLLIVGANLTVYVLMAAECHIESNIYRVGYVGSVRV